LNDESAPSATYDELAPFLKFIDKYTIAAIGKQALANFLKENKDSSVLDLLRPSDIAYTILCFDMNRNVWSKKMMTECPPLVVATSARGAGEDGDEGTEESLSREDAPIYFKKAAHNKTYSDGWTDLGRGRLVELTNIFHKAMGGVFWEELQGHWKQYSLTTNLPFYTQALDSSVPSLPSPATDENQREPKGIIHLPDDDDDGEEEEYQRDSDNEESNYRGGGYESSSSYDMHVEPI
jgi:hypothetical protein